MAKLDDRIAALKGRLKQLETKKSLATARQRTQEARRSRAAELRRKVLVGTIVIERADRGKLDREELQRWLDESLVRAEDRELFGLARKAEADDSGRVMK